MDPDDHALIIANSERFGVTNLVPVLGQAPEAWENLPAPDAVFVGGTGRHVSRIVELAYAKLRPRGRIVATMSSIENLHDVQQALHRLAGDAAVWMINISRGVEQIDRMKFEAMNPTFLIGAVKG
jgi:precorrin-6Y C5,15-methyltransferase (decarboxylating)